MRDEWALIKCTLPGTPPRAIACAGVMRGYEHLRHAFAKQLRCDWDSRVGRELPVIKRVPMPQVARIRQQTPKHPVSWLLHPTLDLRTFKPPFDWGTLVAKARASVISLRISIFRFFFTF